MVYVIYFFAGAFVVLSATMFFAYYRSRHFGLFIMALTYATSGLLAAALPHWWPLLTGFVLAWLLRLVGLEPRIEARDEGGEKSKDEGKNENEAAKK